MSEVKTVICDCGCGKEARAGTFNAPGWIRVSGGEPYRHLDFATWECFSRFALEQLPVVLLQEKTEAIIKARGD